jgi:hypothetical protein
MSARRSPAPTFISVGGDFSSIDRNAALVIDELQTTIYQHVVIAIRSSYGEALPWIWNC